MLAGTAPQGAPDLHRWSDDVYTYACEDVTTPENFLALFFSGSEASTQRGWEYLNRTHTRTADRDPETTLACRDAQYQALMTWGSRNPRNWNACRRSPSPPWWPTETTTP